MNLSQLFILGLPADNDLAFVRDFRPGGVILMGRNARPFGEVQELTAQLRAELERPIVSTDHEGGRVQRLREGFEALPPARELGSFGKGSVWETAARVGRQLRRSGVNLNFAPVCDVPIHPNDTVIGSRAFSVGFEGAGVCEAAYIEGLQGAGVGACAKHFPGHGGVGVDSHFGLPAFAGTRAELEPHLGPFRAAIGVGVSAVMVAHIEVPTLDPSGNPSSLSAPITTDLLRGELGFAGLVVSDDLEMGALATISAGALAVRALTAGCDALLFCHSNDKATEARAAIERAVTRGELDAARIEEALGHVQRWKDRFAASPSFPSLPGDFSRRETGEASPQPNLR